MTASRQLAALALLMGFSACIDFDNVDRGLCGNRIHEPERGEDCDGAGIDGNECGKQGDANACRLLCNEGACPDGWACGDGVCRQPSGQFAPLATIATKDVASLLAADFDGDGRADLAVTADENDDQLTNRLTVHFFDGTGVRESVHDGTPLKARVPLTAGPIGDVGVGTSLFVAPNPRTASVMALRGLSSGGVRTLLPALAPQYRGLGLDTVLGPVAADLIGDSGKLRVFDSDRVLFGQLGNVLGPKPNYIVESPLLIAVDAELDPNQALAPHTVNAVFEEFFDSQQTIAAYTDATSVQAYSIEVSSSGVWPHLEVAMPEGVGVGAGVFTSDPNFDFNPDLLVAANDGNTYVAWGDGLFHSNAEYSGVGFHSNRDNAAALIFGEPPDYAFDPEPYILGAHPIATGDINGDAVTDYVFLEHGVALSDPDLFFAKHLYCPEPFNQTAEYACGLHEGGVDIDAEFDTLPVWTEAAIADINSDGWLDVVATVGDRAEIDVLFSGPNDSMRRHRVPTRSPASRLVTGDFDGDTIGDFAFQDGDVGEPAAIWVVYGRTDGGPPAPTKVLEASVIAGLQVSALGTDLFILSRGADDEDLSLSVARGGKGRRLVAPLTIPCPLDGTDSTAVAQQMLVGRFDEEDGADAALLYRDCFRPNNSDPRDQLVLLSATGPATLRAPFRQPMDWDCTANIVGCKQGFQAFHPESAAVQEVAGWAGISDRWSEKALMVTVDLDADARDEVVMIGPDENDLGHVLVARPGATRFAYDEPIATPHSVGGSYGSPRGRIATADLDGAHGLDVLVLTSGRQAEPLLVVYLNDGEGGLDVEGAFPIDVGSLGNVIDFAIVDANYDGIDDQVLLATESDGVHLARLDVALRTIMDPVALSEDTNEQVAAGDFDGDGLLDFAVVSGDEVLVYENVPDNP